jgi:hypothetical protein
MKFQIQIDDIFAALILSLAMLRRLEVRTTTAAHNPNVPEEQFGRWRALAMRAYEQTAAASAAKVVLSVGWFLLGQKLGVVSPWFQLVGFSVFMAWALVLVWAWKIGTDARHMRLSLGIRLRRQVAAAGASAPPRATDSARATE